jgi:sulfur carrier protein ThiS adenylyltransferase
MAMKIYLNEIGQNVDPDTTLYSLRDDRFPQADVLIVNGFPAGADQPLNDNDRVVMIERGRIPAADEMEALMMARHTPGVHQKIKQGVVGIAGVGGLGSNIAIALARTGVGTLIIADFDVVEPSNLNRQQFFIDQIGLPKVEALKATLERINPAVKIVSHFVRITPDNLDALFGRVDILVEAFDSARQKAMLTNSFLKKYSDKHLVAASGVAGFESSNSIVTQKVTEQLILCGDGITAAAPGCGLMAPRVGVAAHHQANAVLRLLLGEPAE